MIIRGRPRLASWVAALLVGGIGLGCATHEDPIGIPDPEAFSMLFVGNSLTYFNDLPAMVGELLREAGVGPVAVASSSFAGYGLQDHWVDARTHDAIAVGNWDYVVLQQGPSATEGRPSLLEYTALFDEEIRAVGATTALYMVWPSSTRGFDFDGVAESYAMAAESVDGVLFPGGEAWRAVWRRDPAIRLYGPDGFHPSFLGSYVVALAIADQLVGAVLEPDHVVETSGGLSTIPPDLGALLLDAAREANANASSLPLVVP